MKYQKTYFVYILTNKINTVFYIGVKGNLMGRILQHKNKEVKGFTEKYNVNKLVYFEEYESISEAIVREKRLKNWQRQWKIDLIKEYNSNLNDLARDWFYD